MFESALSGIEMDILTKIINVLLKCMIHYFLASALLFSRKSLLIGSLRTTTYSQQPFLKENIFSHQNLCLLAPIIAKPLWTDMFRQSRGVKL